MNVKINNVVLEKNRFRVSISFDNGVNESNVFMPEITANDILAWVQSRLDYHQGLQDIEIQLVNDLKEKEYNLLIFDELYKKDEDFRKKIDSIKDEISKNN